MSVPVGSHIKDKVKKEAAKVKRDTCEYYIRYYGACAVGKKLACSVCIKHKFKLTKRDVANEAKRRGTSPDNNKSVSEQPPLVALFPIIPSTTPSLHSLENKHNQKSP